MELYKPNKVKENNDFIFKYNEVDEECINGGKIIISSPLNPPPGSRFENMINTVVHEFTHVIISKIN